MDAQARLAFAEQIRPAVRGKSDKFSWRLYLRAAKNGRERVYVSAWDNLYGKPFSPSLDALKAGEKLHLRLLYIGYMHDGGFFSGQSVRDVCRHGKSHYDFSYGPGFNTAGWLDVTDWFWGDYIRLGRCIVWPDQAHEWLMINRNARKCVHCGKHEQRRVITKKTVVRIDSWEGLDVPVFKAQLHKQCQDFLDPPF